MVFEKNKQLWFLTYFDWFCGLIPTGIPVLVEFSINRGVRSVIFITLFLYLCNSLIKSSEEAPSWLTHEMIIYSMKISDLAGIQFSSPLTWMKSWC